MEGRAREDTTYVKTRDEARTIKLGIPFTARLTSQLRNYNGESGGFAATYTGNGIPIRMTGRAPS